VVIINFIDEKEIVQIYMIESNFLFITLINSSQYVNIEFTDYLYATPILPIVTVRQYLNANKNKLLIQTENSLKAGIYLWQNNINGHCYVGSANNLWDRLRKYYYEHHLNLPRHKNLPILSALKKHGHENFNLYIVEYVEQYNKDKLLNREQYYLDELKPYYNILDKAGSSLGYTHTEEVKQLISDFKKELYIGENNPFYGKTHTEETKQLISAYQSSREDHPFNKIGEDAINYDRKHSEESKLILPNKLSGSNNPAYGHTYATPPKKVKIFSKEDNTLLEEYSSIRDAAKELKSSAQTIKKYSNNQELFKDKYYLKITEE
jgi:group I intron endonuclease